MAESEEELQSLLMKVKEEREKVGLKLSIQKTKIMASGPITSWEIDGKTMETVADFIFLGSKITADDDWSHERKRRLLLGRKAITNRGSVLKSRDVTLPTKVLIGKAMILSSSHVWMWQLDHKESWALKNWCFWTLVLEKTLESPLNCKQNKPVNPKGNQFWIFTGGTDAETEAPILWPLDSKSQLIRKDSDAGKDWRQEKKGATETEMVGWHHWFNGREFKKTLGNGEAEGSLACCSPWDCKELDMTKQLNNCRNNRAVCFPLMQIILLFNRSWL